MKLLITTLSLTFLTAPFTLSAGTPAADSPLQEELSTDAKGEVKEEEEDTEILAEQMPAELTLDDRRDEWNQWVCQAYAPGSLRSYNGRSFFFRAGSGEGQQAKRQARREAVRNCEFRTGKNCRSNLDRDCRVRRIERD